MRPTKVLASTLVKMENGLSRFWNLTQDNEFVLFSLNLYAVSLSFLSLGIGLVGCPDHHSLVLLSSVSESVLQ